MPDAVNRVRLESGLEFSSEKENSYLAVSLKTRSIGTIPLEVPLVPLM